MNRSEPIINQVGGTARTRVCLLGGPCENVVGTIFDQGSRGRNNQLENLGFVEDLESEYDSEKDCERARKIVNVLEHFLRE